MAPSGLLTDWEPNFAYQPWLMFLTYAFLHGGLAHLAVNMVTLWSLGRPKRDTGRGTLRDCHVCVAARATPGSATGDRRA